MEHSSLPMRKKHYLPGISIRGIFYLRRERQEIIGVGHIIHLLNFLPTIHHTLSLLLPPGWLSQQCAPGLGASSVVCNRIALQAGPQRGHLSWLSYLKCTLRCPCAHVLQPERLRLEFRGIFCVAAVLVGSVCLWKCLGCKKKYKS